MPDLLVNIDVPGQVDPESVRGTVELWGAGARASGIETATGKLVGGARTADGPTLSFTGLVGNAAIGAPAGTVYRLLVSWAGLAAPVERFLTMPTTGGPYTLNQVETDPPGALTPSALSAHAADTALHGGGQELALANVSANFSTASTTFVDVPGASITFIVPSRPFVVTFSVPVNVEEAGQGAEMRIVGGATPTQIDWDFTPRATVAGQVFKQFLRARVPCPTFTPTPGTSVTFKGQVRTIVATSDVSIVVDFGGPFQLSQLHVVTC